VPFAIRLARSIHWSCFLKATGCTCILRSPNACGISYPQMQPPKEPRLYSFSLHAHNVKAAATIRRPSSPPSARHFKDFRASPCWGRGSGHGLEARSNRWKGFIRAHDDEKVGERGQSRYCKEPSATEHESPTGHREVPTCIATMPGVPHRQVTPQFRHWFARVVCSRQKVSMMGPLVTREQSSGRVRGAPSPVAFRKNSIRQTLRSKCGSEISLEGLIGNIGHLEVRLMVLRAARVALLGKKVLPCLPCTGQGELTAFD
jgi:hypothetical protein